MLQLTAQGETFQVKHLIYNSSSFAIFESEELGGIIGLPFTCYHAWKQMRDQGFKIVGTGNVKKAIFYRLEAHHEPRDDKNNHLQDGREGVRRAVRGRLEDQRGDSSWPVVSKGLPEVPQPDTSSTGQRGQG